jgi:hypothetical protein
VCNRVIQLEEIHKRSNDLGWGCAGVEFGQKAYDKETKYSS